MNNVLKLVNNLSTPTALLYLFMFCIVFGNWLCLDRERHWRSFMDDIMGWSCLLISPWIKSLMTYFSLHHREVCNFSSSWLMDMSFPVPTLTVNYFSFVDIWEQHDGCHMWSRTCLPWCYPWFYRGACCASLLYVSLVSTFCLTKCCTILFHALVRRFVYIWATISFGD